VGDFEGGGGVLQRGKSTVWGRCQEARESMAKLHTGIVWAFHIGRMYQQRHSGYLYIRYDRWVGGERWEAWCLVPGAWLECDTSVAQYT
jgi:hypothetical protein